MKRIIMVLLLVVGSLLATSAQAAITWQGEFSQFRYDISRNGGDFYYLPYMYFTSKQSTSLYYYAPLSGHTDPYNSVAVGNLTEFVDQPGEILMNAMAKATGTSSSPVDGLVVQAFAETIPNGLDEGQGVDIGQRVQSWVTRLFTVDTAAEHNLQITLEGAVDFDAFDISSLYRAEYSVIAQVNLEQGVDDGSGTLIFQNASGFPVFVDVGEPDQILTVLLSPEDDQQRAITYRLKVDLILTSNIINVNPQTFIANGPLVGNYSLGSAAAPMTLRASLSSQPTGTIALTPNPASIAADGASTTTITSSAIKNSQGVNVPDGTAITVATTAGTITTADADGTEPGVQVLTSGGVITFTLQSPTTIGTATVTAESVSGAASGSTTVSFTAGPVSAGESTVQLDRTSAPVGTGGGDGITVTVTLKDAQDHPIVGTEAFLSITGSGNYINGAALGNGPVSIGVTNGSGVATGVIKSTWAEVKTISATGGATTITQTRSVTYTPGAANAAQSVISGTLSPATITADATANATVQFRDQYGNLTTSLGGASLSAAGSTLAGANWTAANNGNGTATATYTPGAAGIETGMRITLGGAQIGANQSVTVTAGVATAAQSVVSAPLSPATITADAAATATVQFRDHKGNLTTNLGGAALAAAGSTLAGANWAVANNANGTATATYTPAAIGSEIGLRITLGGAQIGTTQSVIVTPGVATAAQSVISAPLNPSTITVDATATATVQFRDQHGNLTTNLGGSALAAAGAALASADWAVTNNANGTATATYTPGAIGNDTSLRITLGGAQVGASQSVTVTPGAAKKLTLVASKTTLASDGKGTATLTARILDQKDNLVDTDNTTVVTFTLTNSTYVSLTGSPATASGGVASATVTTKPGTVPVPPATTEVNVASVPVLTPPAGVTLSIVNFSIRVNAPVAPFVDGTGVHLVTSGSTPSAATFEGVGSTSGDYRWALTGVGTISSTTANGITYTAPASITGTSQTGKLTLTSATDPNLTNDINITVYNPVAITWPAAAAGIAMGDSTKTVTASGSRGPYKFESSDPTKAAVNPDTGALTPVAAGTVTVRVRDATYGAFGTANGFLAVTPNIEIVARIAVSPATQKLLGTETQSFGATGGKGAGIASNYTWSVNNAGAGSITANGLFTAANVTAAQTATITATDKTYTNISGTATLNVYPKLAFELPEGYDPSNPVTWPLVLPGGSYAFMVTGGEGSSYTWTVQGPMPVDGGTEGTFTFAAPTAGAFAGVYTVTVTDDQTGKTFSMNIRVPLTITPGNLSMLGDSAVTYDFVVAGAPEGTGFAVALVTTAKANIAYPAEYGAVDPQEGAFAASATADFGFTPADITGSYKSFLFKVQATEVGEETPLKDAALDILHSDLMRIFPVAEFSGRVEDVNGDPIAGVEVKVLLGTDDIIEETATEDSGEFSFKVGDPATSGLQYTVAFAAEGYVTQVASTEGWENPEVIVLVQAAGSISGSVSDGGAPIAGAIVECTLDDQDLVALTDGDGNYTLNLPRVLAEGEVLKARASKLGYVAAEQDIVQQPEFMLEPQSGEAEQGVCEAGGSFVWGPAVVDIPAGVLDACYTVEVDENIPVGTVGHCTAKSVVLVAITISDDTGADAPLAKPIRITMPFNVEVVGAGDFKAGKAVIYYAETVDVLRSGNDTSVDWIPVSDILVEDRINGMVTFQVSHLSVFGIGDATTPAPTPTPTPIPTPTPTLTPVGSGGGGGGCFIDTMRGSWSGGWFALLMLMIVATGVAVIKLAAK